MLDDFSSNLKLLCSYYKSISEVCRRLDINRAQFNRYLYGRSRPSAHTLRRFCDFFGVEEYEMLLPHDQFQRLIQIRPHVQEEAPASAPMQEHLDKLMQFSSSELEKYLGYYFEYYYSFAVPGKILRNLVRMEMRDGQVVYQRVERLQQPGGDVHHNKYLGLVLLTDRLFLIDYESVNRNEVTQTVLFTSLKHRVSRISGLKMGVADNVERMPCAARVVYESLGTNIDVRKALRMCGLHEADDRSIDDAIKATIDNHVGAGDWHLRGKPI